MQTITTFPPFKKVLDVSQFRFCFWNTVSHRSVTENVVFSLLLGTVQVFRSQVTMQMALLHISLDLNSVGIVYRRQCLFSEDWIV